LHPLVDGIRTGNRRALARAISQVEDDGAESRDLLAALYPDTGRAHIIGVTGAPGAGKSTLVNALARAYRVAGYSVGVIAVDPSSPFTGGALLGDRLRMHDLAGDPGVFIRSMASRGGLGGLARATGDAIQLLDAAGFERVLVETVGAGQTEVDIAAEAHTTVVIEAPGMGDEVQAFKAGLLEIADVLVVNKADRAEADRAVLALQAMQSLAPSGHHGLQPGQGRMPEPGPQPDGGWLPPILKTVATTGDGIEPLRDWVEAHAHYLHATDAFVRREAARATTIFRRILCERLARAALDRLHPEQFDDLIADIVSRKLDPHTAVERVLSAGGCP
jgi:LAO/AO transport system kinase